MANNAFGGKMPFNPQVLMKQAQKMMEDAETAEAQLADVRVEGSSGGGLVKVTVTGKGDILEVKIANEAVDPEEIELLEDLVVTAVRDAVDKANAMRSQTLQGIMPGDINIPGLF